MNRLIHPVMSAFQITHESKCRAPGLRRAASHGLLTESRPAGGAGCLGRGRAVSPPHEGPGGERQQSRVAVVRSRDATTAGRLCCCPGLRRCRPAVVRSRDATTAGRLCCCPGLRRCRPAVVRSLDATTATRLCCRSPPGIRGRPSPDRAPPPQVPLISSSAGLACPGCAEAGRGAQRLRVSDAMAGQGQAASLTRGRCHSGADPPPPSDPCQAARWWPGEAALAHRRHPIRAEQPDGGRAKRRWPAAAVMVAALAQRCYPIRAKRPGGGRAKRRWPAAAIRSGQGSPMVAGRSGAGPPPRLWWRRWPNAAIRSVQSSQVVAGRSGAGLPPPSAPCQAARWWPGEAALAYRRGYWCGSGSAMSSGSGALRPVRVSDAVDPPARSAADAGKPIPGQGRDLRGGPGRRPHQPQLQPDYSLHHQPQPAARPPSAPPTAVGTFNHRRRTGPQSAPNRSRHPTTTGTLRPQPTPDTVGTCGHSRHRATAGTAARAGTLEAGMPVAGSWVRGSDAGRE
jgi:hypothetical protein